MCYIVYRTLPTFPKDEVGDEQRTKRTELLAKTLSLFNNLIKWLKIINAKRISPPVLLDVLGDQHGASFANLSVIRGTSEM